MKYKEMLIVLLIAVIVYLLFQKRPMYSAGRLQTIEHVIQGKDSIVTIWKTKIVQDKGRIKGLTNQVERYKDSLDIARELKDTVLIIDTQDTIIKQLELNIRYYDELVEACDSVMTNQNHLIELKDSVIMIQRNELNDLSKKRKKGKFFNMVGKIATGVVGVITGYKIYKAIK
jgi:hypothetical protein